MKHQNLLATLYQKPKNCETILKMLPELEKNCSQEQIQVLKQDCYENLLQEAIHTNVVKFEDSWKHLPHRFKKDMYFLNLYIQGLIQYHDAEKAESLTRKLLKREWFIPLVHTYGLIKTPHPEHQLSHAEKWLKNHPNDPNLLLSLGRLCKQLQLWGKAKDYLETSLIHAPSNPETNQELGELFESLGEPILALKYYKKTLKIGIETRNSI